ncbi:Hypothetical predicted protein [Pelobates cultripes]|uniref:Uncharacterized protein n=1 Tax=Pelobates cultripes TaxID=61616 RepID=A0AAD1R0I7_PELCU|nr:Hypothetical predicted protein [Pelobates cultripes]
MIVKSERRTRLVLMAKPTIFVKVLQTIHDMSLRRSENISDIEMLDLSAPSTDRSASTEDRSAPSDDRSAPTEDLSAPSEDLSAPGETSIYDHEYISGFNYKLALDKSFRNNTIDRSFVTNSKLEKDFPHLVHFCHTGSLEVFHSLVLKYHPKRVHFTMDWMVAGTQLAVLAHNANVGREQATIHKEQEGSGHIGDLRFKPFFSKRSKNLKIKKIYEKNNYCPYIFNDG